MPSESPLSLNLRLFTNLEAPRTSFFFCLFAFYGGSIMQAWLKHWPLVTELYLQPPAPPSQ